MKTNLFYLLLLPLLLGLAACSKDDDDRESPEKKEQKIKETIVGRWHQTNATLNGKSAHVELHLMENGNGHAVFKTTGSRQDINVSYSSLTYKINGENITFSGSDIGRLNGTFTLKWTYSSGIVLANTATSEELTFYKSAAESELLEYKWKMRLGDSYGSNYFLYDFQSPSSGTMRYVRDTASDYLDYTFTYTFDYANGPMTINWSDGSQDYYFYSAHIGIDLILLGRKSGSSDVYYWILTRESR